MLPDRGFSGAWGVAGGRLTDRRPSEGRPGGAQHACRRRRPQPVDVSPRSGFFSDISNCLTHASIGFDGAGELFEARAYTYDLLRAAYLVWIELAGARSGADGPPRLFARRAAPALPRGPRTPWCGFRVVWCLGDLDWPGGPRWRLRRRGADSVF